MQSESSFMPEIQTQTVSPNEQRDVVIRVEGVRKTFGEVTALKHVDLTVEKGTVLGLLGPNGAGKTTLVRILTTLLSPDGGHASIAGYDVVKERTALRRVIGLAGQYAAVDENLSGRENLVMVGQLYHLGSRRARERADELLERFDLNKAAHRPTRQYSGGMRRRLDLAASLVAAPRVLFLDEPTTGLDPRSRIGLWEMIEELVAEGTTLLLTTQYLQEADYLADRIAVIDHGRIIARGSADELKQQIGGDILDLHITERARTREAAEALARLGEGEPHTEEDAGHITFSVAHGASVLADTVRALDQASIGIADIALRRPSLDEVFLALTGQEDSTATDREDTHA
jgi:ABC-2 type transport system ATP-binding protein